MTKLIVNYEITKDDMCTLTWDINIIPHLRYSVNGRDVTGRNKLYEEPFWIGESDVVKLKGYDNNMNQITDQVEFPVTYGKGLIDQDLSNETIIGIETPICLTKSDDSPSLDSEEFELKSDVEDNESDSYTHSIEKVDETDESETIEDDYDGCDLFASEIEEVEKPSMTVNTTIEAAKPNYVKIIYNSQLNAYHVTVYKNFLTDEENFYYSSVTDAINKVTQFKPNKVRVSVDKFATHYIKTLLIDKGYVVNYI